MASNEIQRAGLRVPDDLSVVSHDDSPAAAHSAVPLTSVSHPFDVVAAHVVECLCERLNNGAQAPDARRIVVRGELKTRQSSAPL